ncbi:MAG: hypothetical protein AAF614_27305, partial [Chloroflexota bacterium]
DVLFKQPQPLPEQEAVAIFTDRLTAENWQEHPNWYAQVMIKQAALQWVDGDDGATGASIADIWTFGGTDPYIAYLRGEWEAAGGEFLPFCRRLHRNIADDPTDIWLIGSDYLYHLGGRFNRTLQAIPTGELVCPSEALTKHLLDAMRSSVSPVEQLKVAGIPVQYEAQAGLDADPDLEWMTIVDAGTLLWLIWDLDGNEWRVQHMWRLQGDNLQAIEFHTDDVANDEQAELVALIKTTGRGIRGDVQRVTNLYVVDWQNGRLRNNQVEAESLDDMPTTIFTDLYDAERYKQTIAGGWLPTFQMGEEVDWLFVLLDSIIELLQSAETAVLARQYLDELQAQIELDAPDARLVLAEIQYLRAYSFMVEGDLIEADRQFEQLINDYPDSFWSILAELQLP